MPTHFSLISREGEFATISREVGTSNAGLCEHSLVGYILEKKIFLCTLSNLALPLVLIAQSF